MSSHFPARVSGLALVLLAAACGNDTAPDAFGNFEAEEVVVAAEAAGRLLSMDAIEGRTIAAGAAVGLVDTTQIALERVQVLAQREAVGLQRREVAQQRNALEVQLEIAHRTRDRVERLAESNAATSSQRDDAERAVRTLTAQVSAAAATEARVEAERRALDARLAAVDDRLRRARVLNPVTGTVLAQYARAGESVAPGQPLYRIAALDTLTLRAYVDGSQLSSLTLGAPVAVYSDAGDGELSEHRGTVQWVSPRAEFTPTPVQTRQERTALVYAVKIRVPNPDGALKVGMPGDLRFGSRP